MNPSYAPPLDTMRSTSSGDITPPPILATPNLSLMSGHTPQSYMHHLPHHRPVLSPNYHIGNIQKPSPGQYSHIHYPHNSPGGHYLPSGGLNLTGVPSVEGLNDLEAMKRALDISSLPSNPISGLAPHIEPSTSSASAFENIPPKKARTSPSYPTTSLSGTPITATHPNASRYTPGQYQPLPYMPNGISTMNANPASPLTLGGPLSTPSQPTNGGPQSPYMGIVNGMGMNFGYPYIGFNPTSPIVSPSMNPAAMTGNYGPAAAAAAAAAAGNTTGRTVYVGNLPSEASVDELLNLVRFGPIEQVRLLPEKSCVFISFLDGSTAAAFHADASVKKLALHGQELKIGWGKASNVPPSIAIAVASNQATRNVFVGNLPEDMNEQDLRNVCSKFGPIDQVKIVRDKNIGFVHFLSISTAIKVVQQLPHEPGWAERRVNYGKDRCAYVPKAQQAAVQAAQAQAAAAMSSQHAQISPGSPFSPFTPMTPGFNMSNFGSPSGFASPLFGGGPSYHSPTSFNDPSFAAQGGNRNIYLGNIHPDTTTEELCNNIRGGVIQQIRHLKDKNIAFVTFVEPQAANTFYNWAMNGLTIGSRRIKVGWGKHSGSMPNNLLAAIQSGASRNVYLGQITDFDIFTIDKLRTDFSEYGDIEMINFLTEKGAAFVNFTSISSAQKAIEGIKSKSEYEALRISYGKDRCANPPRGMMQTPNGQSSSRPVNPRASSSNDANDPISAKIAAMERSAAADNGDGSSGVSGPNGQSGAAHQGAAGAADVKMESVE